MYVGLIIDSYIFDFWGIYYIWYNIICKYYLEVEKYVELYYECVISKV